MFSCRCGVFVCLCVPLLPSRTKHVPRAPSSSALPPSSSVPFFTQRTRKHHDNPMATGISRSANSLSSPFMFTRAIGTSVFCLLYGVVFATARETLLYSYSNRLLPSCRDIWVLTCFLHPIPCGRCREHIYGIIINHFQGLSGWRGPKFLRDLQPFTEVQKTCGVGQVCGDLTLDRSVTCLSLLDQEF